MERGLGVPCATRLRRLARRGAGRLSDPACERVRAYVEGQRARDGGYRGRNGASDLYYSLFALNVLDALGMLDRARAVSVDYLDRYEEGAELDLIDLCCLARCLALMPDRWPRAVRVALRLDGFVAAGGGFRPLRGVADGSIAASFAAQLAYEELDLRLPVDARIDACLTTKRSADGGWSDVPGLEQGTTTVTAAVSLLRSSRGEPANGASHWLAARHVAAGGFLASPIAPVPDLVSTAAALAALDAAGAASTVPAEATMGFVESLWSDDGGFRGCADDPLSDCELTYYALVALGALDALGMDAS